MVRVLSQSIISHDSGEARLKFKWRHLRHALRWIASTARRECACQRAQPREMHYAAYECPIFFIRDIGLGLNYPRGRNDDPTVQSLKGHCRTDIFRSWGERSFSLATTFRAFPTAGRRHPASFDPPEKWDNPYFT
jgi:hypothetical protein